jgi:hypothetical protein
LRSERLARLVTRAVESTALDLSGLHVLTEAATGAYAVTPVIAAVGGAKSVSAVTRATRHGSVEDVVVSTMDLARLLGVASRITIHDGALSPELVGAADIITNSGHVRPIDARVAGWMNPRAVVPLMFEAWEIDLGRDDVDLGALTSRGIRFAGTNERHPNVDVFSYLGPMAVKLITDAAVSVYGARILVICDNPFAEYLHNGLRRAGASVVERTDFDVEDLGDELDVVLVALKPRGRPVLTEGDVTAIAERAPGALLAQFWGDVPRAWCDARSVPCVPATEPGPGHMGVLPSAVGPEPIVRLQAGGLKVAQLLRRDRTRWTDDDRQFVDEL